MYWFNNFYNNKYHETCDKSGLTMPIAEYGNLNVVKDGEGTEAPILAGPTPLTPWLVYNTLVTGRERRCRVGWIVSRMKSSGSSPLSWPHWETRPGLGCGRPRSCTGVPQRTDMYDDAY